MGKMNLFRGYLTALALTFVACGPGDPSESIADPTVAESSVPADVASLQSLPQGDAQASTIQRVTTPDPVQQPLCGWGCVQACKRCLASHRDPEDCEGRCSCNDPETCCPGGRCP